MIKGLLWLIECVVDFLVEFLCFASSGKFCRVKFDMVLVFRLLVELRLLLVLSCDGGDTISPRSTGVVKISWNR